MSMYPLNPKISKNNKDNQFWVSRIFPYKVYFKLKSHLKENFSKVYFSPLINSKLIDTVSDPFLNVKAWKLQAWLFKWFVVEHIFFPLNESREL